MQHVQLLHADGDIGFSKEYEAIQAASTQDSLSAEHSHHPDNKQKNRYLNIVACECPPWSGWSTWEYAVVEGCSYIYTDQLNASPT